MVGQDGAHRRTMARRGPHGHEGFRGSHATVASRNAPARGVSPQGAKDSRVDSTLLVFPRPFLGHILQRSPDQ